MTPDKPQELQLTEEELGALKAFIGEEIIKRAQSVAYGILDGRQTKTRRGALMPIIAMATVIGETDGVVKITLLKDSEHPIDGITLTYWTMEAKRTAEGLKVKIAVEPERKEGVLFAIEGVVVPNERAGR
ncbi:MAG: hypothetical protein RXO24_05435 [Acidilobus sp.]